MEQVIPVKLRPIVTSVPLVLSKVGSPGANRIISPDSRSPRFSRRAHPVMERLPISLTSLENKYAARRIIYQNQIIRPAAHSLRQPPCVIHFRGAELLKIIFIFSRPLEALRHQYDLDGFHPTTKILRTGGLSVHRQPIQPISCTWTRYQISQ